MSVQAFLDERLPRPAVGQRVKLLGYPNAATKGTTHEVREADRVFGPFGFYFGSKKACLQFMADRGLHCVNLADWGVEQLPEPQLPFSADVEQLLYGPEGVLDTSPPVQPDLKRWTGSPRFHLTEE